VANNTRPKKIRHRIITFLLSNDLHAISCVEWAVAYKDATNKIDVELEWLKCALHYLKNRSLNLTDRHLVGAMYVHREDSLSLPRSRWIDGSNLALDTSTPSVRDMQFKNLHDELQREVDGDIIRNLRGSDDNPTEDPKVH